MYRICDVIERKLPGQLFHYRQFIFATRCKQRINFPFYFCKKQLLTSVRLSIVDRLFNCLDFFAVVPIKNKYRLRFGTWKIQIFVETHKKSSSYELSTLSLFFFLDVLRNYPRRLVTRCKRFSETGKIEFQAPRLYRSKSSLAVRPMLSFSSSLHISILVFSPAFALKPTAKKYSGTPTVIRQRFFYEFH